MRSPFRRGPFALALIAASAALMLGTAFVRSGAGADGEAGDAALTVGALAPIFAARTHRTFVPLSDEERAQVFDGVMRLGGVPVADVDPPEDAAALPLFVDLQELPVAVVLQIPRIEGYKFVKLDDRILLVHPRSRKVVAEMPRYKLVLQ